MNQEELQQFFEKTIEENKGILFKIARTYCSNEEDRQDLMQEMMVQIWQSLGKYNSQYALSTWLYRISLNTAISFYRKKTVREKNTTELNEQVEQLSDASHNDIEIQLKLLEQFISELKEVDKALMILYLEGKSHAEIADILGMSVSNVGTKIGRIKDHLKQKFEKLKR